MSEHEKTILVECLNDIIKNAVIHGGDCGGAYMSNPQGLLEAIETLRKWRLSDYIIVESPYGYALAKPADLSVVTATESQ